MFSAGLFQRFLDSFPVLDLGALRSHFCRCFRGSCVCFSLSGFAFSLDLPHSHSGLFSHHSCFHAFRKKGSRRVSLIQFSLQVNEIVISLMFESSVELFGTMSPLGGDVEFFGEILIVFDRGVERV